MDPKTRNADLVDLGEKLHIALFVADKMTANGYDVMRRRSSFVAGERLHEGDLKEFGFDFYNDRDKLLVVAAESALRLGFINPESMYPDRLKVVVGPLYETQREYVRGVYRALGVSNKEITQLLLGEDPGTGQRRKRSDGKSMAAIRAEKFGIPLDFDKLTTALAERTGITDAAIEETPLSVTDAARETVAYFSFGYETDLDELTREWKPETDVARRWHAQMMDQLIQAE